MHETYYGDKIAPPIKQITGKFNARQMTYEQLQEYLLRVRSLRAKLA